MVLLKNESFEEKYCFGNNDGDKIFWNITKMRDYVKNKNIPIKSFKINELYEYNQSPINQKYAMETDYKIPGILVELIKGKLFYKLIDGNHRLYKAKIFGEEIINCYYFIFEEQIKFVIDIDNKPISITKYYSVIDKTIKNKL
jgi:hypothetical protein